MCKRCISTNSLACPNNEISMIIQSAFWLVVWHVFPSAASAPGVLSLRGELDKRLTQLKACRVISKRQHLQWCQNFKHISHAEFGKVQTLMSRYLKQVSTVVLEGFIQVVRSLAPLCTILPFMNSYIVPHDQTITPSRWWNIFKSLTIFVVCSNRCLYFGTCLTVWQVQLPTSLSIDLPLLPLAWKKHQRSWDTQHRMFLWGGMGCLNFSGRNNPVIIFFKIALREDHPKTCQTCSWICHLWGL